MQTVLEQDALERAAEDWQEEGATGADRAGAGRAGEGSRGVARGRSCWCRQCWSRMRWCVHQRIGKRKELIVQMVLEQDAMESAAEDQQEDGAASADGAGAGRDGACSRAVARGRSCWCRWCLSRMRWSVQQRSDKKNKGIVWARPGSSGNRPGIVRGSSGIGRPEKTARPGFLHTWGSRKPNPKDL